MVVTIDRPEAMNAVDSAVAAGIGSAVEDAEHDPDTWVVVLTGAGGRAFCAGADLKALARGETNTAPGHEEWGFAGFVDHFTSKPVIAAVEGFALGGGTELCLACDLVVAGVGARFGLPETSRGIIAGGGALIRLPAQIGLKVAMHLVLTGEQISATDAERFGLVNEVVPDGAALERALALAEQICKNAPLAVQASKRVITGRSTVAQSHQRDRWAESRAERTQIGASDDAHEGALAFVERRKPRWTAH